MSVLLNIYAETLSTTQTEKKEPTEHKHKWSRNNTIFSSRKLIPKLKACPCPQDKSYNIKRLG